jgi:hypothetical protein
MVFDTMRFIDDHLVNADAVVGLANHLRVDVPTKDTLRKWFTRGSIPGEWWPVMLALLEKDAGRPVSLVQYLEGGTVHVADIFA